MLMPSHAKIVKPYRDPAPLFAKYGVEAQLDAMFSNHVTLQSGGYLVINPTEALVSIDVNSGRSTREHNIEDTALKTNLEAAEEIARQLRLRDLAGLIVIDFIDMEEKRNNRAVEKKLNECLKNDRARIQVGRISPFGLLEMSRQRIRTGVLESSSVPCPHCAGTGSCARRRRSRCTSCARSRRRSSRAPRTTSSCARGWRWRSTSSTRSASHLRELETRFGVSDHHRRRREPHRHQRPIAVDRGEPALKLEHKAPATGVQIDAVVPVDEPVDVEDEIERGGAEEEVSADAAEGEPIRAAAATARRAWRRRRRRRRRRRSGRSETASSPQVRTRRARPESDEDEGERIGRRRDRGRRSRAARAAGGDEERNIRRRRRGRRGGRGRDRDREGREAPGQAANGADARRHAAKAGRRYRGAGGRRACRRHIRDLRPGGYAPGHGNRCRSACPGVSRPGAR